MVYFYSVVFTSLKDVNTICANKSLSSQSKDHVFQETLRQLFTVVIGVLCRYTHTLAAAQ